MTNTSCGNDLKERYEKMYGASRELRETRTTLKQSKKLLLNQTSDSFGFNPGDSSQHLLIKNDDGLDNLKHFGTNLRTTRNDQLSKTNLNFQITPKNRNATLMNRT